ncbi:MAG: hypothetical protein HUU60_06025 [Armatimonadetes bacterium]|nr:hypothetical protein [Armatimonadota bacterium]
MSVRINTNISSMTALRNVLRTANGLGMSTERLSSGLRINRASDDPAGLIISENLRAQISGIQQAVSNSQDATNLIKTAEGALDEVHTLLRSMRSLAVHAANIGVGDTNSLQADQNQIRSALQSIDRIAGQTSFGAKRLLDGTAGVSTSVTNSSVLGGANFTASFNGSALSTGLVSMFVTTAGTRAAVAGTATYAALTSTVGSGTIVINGAQVSLNGTDTVQGLMDKINALSNVTGVTANSNFANGSLVVNLSHVNYGTNFSISLNDASGRIRSGNTDASGTNAVARIEVMTSAGVTSSLFTGGRFSGDSGLRLTDAAGNAILLTEAGNVASSATAAVAKVTAGDLQFQVGAGAGQSVRVSLNDARALRLGTGVVAGLSLADIDVTAAGGADNAIKIIDEAIRQVSRQRGEIGSFQTNILESNIRSLNVARENLAATESSIRDLDVADEMTTFTKLQILQQSGMAVLAQANSMPQSLLQLLR